MIQLLAVNYRDPLEVVQGIGLIDALAIPFYILIFYAIGTVIRNKYYQDKPWGKYLLPGLTIKLFGGLLFAIIYVYYYDTKGDTFFYFDGAKQVWRAFWDSPYVGFKVLAVSPGVYTDATFAYTSAIPRFWKGDTEFVYMCKLLGVINVLSFNTYWLSTILIAGLSFTGLWKLYETFVHYYPPLYRQLAWAVLFVPSALFWGSGILKDTASIGALGWFVFSIHSVLTLRKSVIKYIVIAVIAGSIVFNLKAYILLGFIPAALIWTFMRFRPNPSVNFLKWTITPILLIAVILFGGKLIQSLSGASDKYALNNLDKRVEGFHDYHNWLREKKGQSGYSLGVSGPLSPAVALAKLPAAVNVTYFRPYLWEVDEPLQFISSIESLVFFILFLWVLLKTGPIRFIGSIFKNPEIAMCMTYAILFGFAVGFTAYNFGALVRFKIPGLPFFLAGLLFIYYEGNEIFRTKTNNRFRRPHGKQLPYD